MIRKSNSVVNVNLSSLQKNIEILSRYLDDDTRIMGVVKADAYGHGAVEIAEVLEPLVEAFAVNDIYEGIELREQDITKPILVFEVPDRSLVSQYREHNLTATISSEEHFGWLPNGTSYHLNFDTGMGRLGFLPSEAKRVAGLVEDHKEIICTGIYTHFATADNPRSRFVTQQHERFKKIRKYFPAKLIAHISNTGGTVFYKTEQFNMVRLGIGMYGYPPGKTEIDGIKPVLSWETRLVQTKRIVANNPVSYGATWEAPEDGYLGVIPVGYEDGIKRSLSGRLSVRVNGKVCDIVGTITMNYSMIFLGPDDYEPGTKVEVLYPENNAGDWAQKIGTIPYEILTSINPKIPREYHS
jgi:alanine racemase